MLLTMRRNGNGMESAVNTKRPSASAVVAQMFILSNVWSAMVAITTDCFSLSTMRPVTVCAFDCTNSSNNNDVMSVVFFIVG